MNKNMIYMLGALTLFFVYKKIVSYKVLKTIPALLAKGGKIIDVRSPAEFEMGHKKGSINIPLNNIVKDIKSLKLTGPIILCCASGTRSAIAKGKLSSNGFKEVVNAGTWRALEKINL